MRALARGLALALALAAATAGAQEHPAPDAAHSVADVPAGPARIVGTVVHPDGPARAADVEVVLYAISADGTPGLRSTRTDATGHFTFDHVAAAGMGYLLAARYQGVPFPGERVAFSQGELEHSTRIDIYDRTRDASGLVVKEAVIQIERLGSELAIQETHRLHNPTNRVFYRTGDERGAGATPAFRARLLADPVHFVLPYAIEPEGLVHTGRDVRFWGPVFPGDQEIAFSYTVPATEGTLPLRWRLPSGAEHASVRVPEGGLALSGPALVAGEPVESDGRKFATFAVEHVAPGGEVALSVEVPPSRWDPDALQVVGARMFLELDDAALAVSEEHYLTVQGDSPLVAPEGEALLRLPLPEDAHDLRFGAKTLAAGATVEDGALVLRGPLPPGPTRLELAYHLPATPDGIDFSRRFPRKLPTLEMYVADTGLEVVSDRLHRLRAVLSDDRLYMHFEGFYIEPGETVAARLVPLHRGKGPARGWVFASVGLASLLAAWVLAGPLLRQRADDVLSGPSESLARREREGLYASIHDLDHDFETGKLSEEDHRSLRAELRARAVDLLAEERAGGRPPARPEVAEAAPACPACAAPLPPDARFCPQCGRGLAADAAAPPADPGAAA